MKTSIQHFLHSLPIPICGLILGTVSLGNLLYSEGMETVGNAFCTLGIFIMGLFLLKV